MKLPMRAWSFLPHGLACVAALCAGLGTALAAGSGHPAPGSAAPVQPGSMVLVRVGAGVITTSDLDAAIAVLPGEERLMLGTPGPLREFVEALIDRRLMADAARQAGLDRGERLAGTLRQDGGTAEARELVLASAYLEHRLAAYPVPDDAALRRYYDEHASEYALPPRVHVERLVLATEEAARAARAAASAGTGLEALSRQQGLAVRSFDTLWLQRPPNPTPVDAAIFALRPGELSGVLRVASGFLLAKVLELAPGGARPFQQVREGIAARLDTQRRDEARRTVVRELRAGASITRDEAALAAYRWHSGPRR